MQIHRAEAILPTEQDIRATFSSFLDANPTIKAKKISEAKDGLIPFLGFCFGIFDVYQILLLAMEIEKKQADYLAGIEALETEQFNLTSELVLAKESHDTALAAMAQELVFKKTSFDNQKTILDAEIADLENQKANLENNLTEQKLAHETEIAANQAAAEKRLATIEKEITAANKKLETSQKAFETLKAKLA